MLISSISLPRSFWNTSRQRFPFTRLFSSKPPEDKSHAPLKVPISSTQGRTLFPSTDPNVRQSQKNEANSKPSHPTNSSSSSPDNSQKKSFTFGRTTGGGRGSFVPPTPSQSKTIFPPPNLPPVDPGSTAPSSLKDATSDSFKAIRDKFSAPTQSNVSHESKQEKISLEQDPNNEDIHKASSSNQAPPQKPTEDDDNEEIKPRSAPVFIPESDDLDLEQFGDLYYNSDGEQDHFVPPLNQTLSLTPVSANAARESLANPPPKRKPNKKDYRKIPSIFESRNPKHADVIAVAGGTVDAPLFEYIAQHFGHFQKVNVEQEFDAEKWENRRKTPYDTINQIFSPEEVTEMFQTQESVPPVGEQGADNDTQKEDEISNFIKEDSGEELSYAEVKAEMDELEAKGGFDELFQVYQDDLGPSSCDDEAGLSSDPEFSSENEIDGGFEAAQADPAQRQQQDSTEDFGSEKSTIPRETKEQKAIKDKVIEEFMAKQEEALTMTDVTNILDVFDEFKKDLEEQFHKCNVQGYRKLSLARNRPGSYLALKLYYRRINKEKTRARLAYLQSRFRPEVLKTQELTPSEKLLLKKTPLTPESLKEDCYFHAESNKPRDTPVVFTEEEKDILGELYDHTKSIAYMGHFTNKQKINMAKAVSKDTYELVNFRRNTLSYMESARIAKLSKDKKETKSIVDNSNPDDYWGEDFYAKDKTRPTKTGITITQPTKTSPVKPTTLKR